MKADKLVAKQAAMESLLSLAVKRQLEIDVNAETITTVVFKSAALELGYIRFRPVMGDEWLNSNRVENGHYKMPVIEQVVTEAVIVEVVKEYVSMSDAAKLVGKSVSTLSRAITAGKLVATKNEKGAYQIEVTDLELYKSTLVA